MNKISYFILVLTVTGITSSCKPQTAKSPEPVTKYRNTGSVERLSPELDRIIDTTSRPEILASGFEWTEGPLWLQSQDMLIFSDIPNNVVYQWTEEDSIKLYLKPAGYTDTTSGREGEQGSNGLLLDAAGNLVLCQHGDRRMARMEAPTGAPAPQFTTLADKYNGKRLNSPNDAVFNSQGDLYFTDPPYGLEKGYEDPDRELDITGVYRLSTEGKLTLIIGDLTAPNGIAFSPDEKKLYVTNSGPGDEGFIMVYAMNSEGSAEDGTIFFRAPSGGGFDGMKVRQDGIVFATGPGGVYILTGEGEHLGTVLTGQATSNCAFDKSGDYLYITADDYLMRIRLK